MNVIANGTKVAIDKGTRVEVRGIVIASYVTSFKHPRVGTINGLFYVIQLDDKYQGYLVPESGEKVSFVSSIVAHSDNVVRA